MNKIERLNAEQLAQVAAAHRQELERRKSARPSDHFPWHDIQKWVLGSAALAKKATRIFLIAGGNRGGKSKVGMGVLSQMLRRESPLSRQLMTTDPSTGRVRAKGSRDPITVWIVPPTLEKARQDWLSPQDQMGLKFWAGELFLKHTEQPDNIIYCRPPGRAVEEMYDSEGKLRKDICDKILIKSQDQRLETFESSEVDLVIFDEEVQDEKIWNSCLLRIATTNGVLMMTYTPLHGLSWSYRRYWRHLIEQGLARNVQDRCWIFDPPKGATIVCAQMGSRDNPRARAYADEIAHDPEMSKAEKDARLDGKYGYVEGTLIPALAGLDVYNPVGKHMVYVVDELPGARRSGVKRAGKIVQWLLVADPNKSYGAVLSALDGDGNLFFVAEHLKEGWPDRRHAESFKEMERRWATGPVARYADPGSAGAQSIVNLADSDLYFETMPKGAGSVSASVKRLRGLTYVDPRHAHPITGQMGAPRVYFYRPGLLNMSVDEHGRKFMGCELASQISQARQTDNTNAPADTPHKDIRSKLDLFDCGRYTAVLVADMLSGEQFNEKRTLPTHPDRLPTDGKALKHLAHTQVDPLDTEFDLPTYDFS